MQWMPVAPVAIFSNLSKPFSVPWNFLIASFQRFHGHSHPMDCLLKLGSQTWQFCAPVTTLDGQVMMTFGLYAPAVPIPNHVLNTIQHVLRLL
jgi:hypothetical protein